MRTASTVGAGATDPELIKQTRLGDVSAFATLYERHHEAAMRLARQLARGSSDADDLVAGAFERVLNQLREGKGPHLSFRAYLLTVLRNLHFRQHNAEKRMVPTDSLHVLDQSFEDEDVVIAQFDNAAAARAFASLPERWQMVLWHLEVEGQRPAQVAPMLGMKPNAVSALAYRAREALQQAYLLQHIADAPDQTHAAVLEQLPAYARGKLGRRDTPRVQRHLEECRTCWAAYAELVQMNSQISALIAPAVLGAVGIGYMTTGARTLLAVVRHPWQWLAHWIHCGPPKAILVHKTITGVSAAALLSAFAALSVVGLSGTAMDTPSAVAAGASPGAHPARTADHPTYDPSPAATYSPATSPGGTAAAPGASSRAPRSASAGSTPTAKDTTDEGRSTGARAGVRLVAALSGLTVKVQAQGDHADAVSVRWKFGDGGTSDERSTSHTYAGPGAYPVQLTITDREGATTVTQVVTLKGSHPAASEPAVVSAAAGVPDEAPTPAMSAAVEATTVRLTGTASHDQDGTILAFSWDFGDGTRGTGPTPAHTYAAPGTYLVRLTVTDDDGARASRRIAVTVRGDRARPCSAHHGRHGRGCHHHGIWRPRH